MTDYSSNLGGDTTQIALLSIPDIPRPHSSSNSNNAHLQPVAYEFTQTDVFPELSEWSRHRPSDNENYFEGIEFESNYNKANITLTMSETNTGFKNIFGKYSVDQNGTMQSVQLLANNTRALEAGAQYSFVHESTQENLQFFLIANGHSYNKNLDDMDAANDSLSFIYKQGSSDERLAKITDDPSHIDLVYKDHEETISLNGKVFHTSSQDLNHDNKSHSISGVVSDGNPNILRIGFEDFPNLGDGDFNDLIVDVEISYIPTHSAMQQPLSEENINTRSEKKETLDEINKNDSLIDSFGINFELYGENGDSLELDIDNRHDSQFSEGTIDTLLEFEKVIQQNSMEDLYIADFVSQTTNLSLPTQHSSVHALITDSVGDAAQYDDAVILIVDFT